jgi:hypothetical protein
LLCHLPQAVGIHLCGAVTAQRLQQTGGCYQRFSQAGSRLLLGSLSGDLKDFQHVVAVVAVLQISPVQRRLVVAQYLTDRVKKRRQGIGGGLRHLRMPQQSGYSQRLELFHKTLDHIETSLPELRRVNIDAGCSQDLGWSFRTTR